MAALAAALVVSWAAPVGAAPLTTYTADRATLEQTLPVPGQDDTYTDVYLRVVRVSDDADYGYTAVQYDAWTYRRSGEEVDTLGYASGQSLDPGLVAMAYGAQRALRTVTVQGELPVTLYDDAFTEVGTSTRTVSASWTAVGSPTVTQSSTRTPDDKRTVVLHETRVERPAEVTLGGVAVEGSLLHVRSRGYCPPDV